MNKRYRYTELIGVVSTALTGVSVTKIVGSGSIISASVDLIESQTPNTVCRATLAFYSTGNPSGAPFGTLISAPISRLSGERFDGRSFMLPDMSVVLNINSNETCKCFVSILVEHDPKE